jgi:hypothetical protein
MAILSQILGSSFGRNPAGANFGGVHMPPLMQPQFRALGNTQKVTDTAVPYAGGPAPAPQTPGQVVGDVGNNFHAMLDQLRQGRTDLRDQGLHGQDYADGMRSLRESLGFGGGGGGFPGGVPNSAGGPGGGPGAGVMGSIMQAFNGGAGGGMDIGKLLSMLPAVMG